MKSTLLSLLISASVSTVFGAEVYFDTVSTSKASRLHGAYFSVYGGGTSVENVDVSSRLDGLKVGDDGGWMAGIKFGYSFDTPLPLRPAAELEIFGLSTDLSGRGNGYSYDSDLAAYGAMGNLVLALDLDGFSGSIGDFVPRLKPYVGAGAGLAYVTQNHIRIKRPGKELKKPEDGGGEIGFGYQLFAGLELELAEEFSVYGEYKFVNLYDISSGQVDGAEFSIWSLGMKVQY
jgi:opacity protein-like surface antigen